MAKKDPVIRFSAQVHSIKTMIDGGINVTLSLSGKETSAIIDLLQVKQQVGAILEVAAVPVVQKAENKPNGKETPKKRKQRYPYKS